MWYSVCSYCGAMNAVSLSSPTAPDAHSDEPHSARPATAGRYRILTELACGGMGRVSLAVTDGPEDFRKLVVVKQLRASIAKDALTRRMFLAEASLAARLNHPNVVQTYEVNTRADPPYLAMEYLEGHTLMDLVRRSDEVGLRPDPRLWVQVVIDALTGLHYAHELEDFDGEPLGVVHRDISPHNIMVTCQGEVRLIDFGVAQIGDADSSGVIVGKMGYLAPEYIDRELIDRRVDVFAMGVSLWEVLTYKRIGAPRRMTRAGRHAYARVGSVVRSIDPKLDAIVARALEISPSRRYPTALALRDALEGWLAQTGGAPSRRELGSLVQALFAEERERIDDVVSAAMAESAPQTSQRETQPLGPWSPPAAEPAPSEGWGPVAAAMLRGVEACPREREIARPARDEAMIALNAMLDRALRVTRWGIAVIALAIVLALLSVGTLAAPNAAAAVQRVLAQ